jgi:hypothetical protein
MSSSAVITSFALVCVQMANRTADELPSAKRFTATRRALLDVRGEHTRLACITARPINPILHCVGDAVRVAEPDVSASSGRCRRGCSARCRRSFRASPTVPTMTRLSVGKQPGICETSPKPPRVAWLISMEWPDVDSAISKLLHRRSRSFGLVELSRASSVAKRRARAVSAAHDREHPDRPMLA